MMEERSQSRLASVITLLAGVWVAISPIWVSVTGGALASVIATGSVIAVAGLVQYFWENPFPSWISGLAAIWLFISTFAFGVGTGADWSQILSAIAVFILSYWDGFEVVQSQEQHKAHPAT